MGAEAASTNGAAAAFDCRRCGHCCEGSGGIILSEHDLERICVHMALGVEVFIAKYAEKKRGKLGIKTGENGFCVFFEAGKGCAVHPGRPDICRAWPFFRGNLEDPLSLDMARQDCPGISRQVDFKEFRRQGLSYLKKHKLLSDGACADADSLKI